MADVVLGNFSNQNDVLEEPICGEYEQYTLIRFLLLSFASLIAMTGLVANTFLFFFFTLRKTPNTPPTMYPGVLAILDWCMCLMYIALFGADAAVVYLSSQTLFLIYHAYIVPAFVVARITQLAIPYMLIFATLERLVWITHPVRSKILRAMYRKKGRYVTMTLTIIICIALRLPVAWAIIVYDFPDCQDFFRTKTANVAPWARESYAYYVFDFHILSIAQTVLPFFILVVLNVMVVRKMIRVQSQSTINSARPSVDSNSYLQTNSLSPNSNCLLENKEGSQQYASLLSPSYGYGRESFSLRLNSFDSTSMVSVRRLSRRTDQAVRAAIYTMLGIVSSYLLSNSLHLILTMLERSESPILIDEHDSALASTFHTYFSDLVSFVYMFTSAARILIYLFCNPAVRKDIAKIVDEFFASCRKPPNKDLSSVPTML